jgi:DNA-binding transcriptional MerR regulator
VISIGTLAQRTGVAVSALRYYDELGLVRPASRQSGHRRYSDDAVKQVGVVVFLRDVGFSLEKIGEMVAGDNWREDVARKIIDIDEQTATLQTARVALRHALDCPAGQPTACPKFWSIIEARLPQNFEPGENAKSASSGS